MDTGSVSISCEGVADKDGVAGVGIELAVGFKGDGDWSEPFAAGEMQFMRRLEELAVLGFHQSNGRGILRGLHAGVPQSGIWRIQKQGICWA
jgi:hypothetical protein